MITYYSNTGQKNADYIRNLLANPPETIAFDAETVSLKERMPLGFAIAFSPEEAIWFPTYPEPTREIELLKPCMFSPKVCKAAHNILFDMGVMPMVPGMEGFDRSNIFDTNTAARLLGRIQTDLPYLASENGENLGIDVTAAKTMLAGKKTMLDIDPIALADKCQRDARATYALYLKYKPLIDSQYKDYFKVEMEVIPILIDISMRGIAIDQGARTEMEAKLEKDIEIYYKIIRDAGIENPGSPQQVGYILGKRGNFLPFTKGGKTRKKKQLSTAEKDLQFLEDPLAVSILEYRGKSKLLNTYIRPMAQQDRFYCLHPSTRILTADLRWLPIVDINPGDEVVGIDKDRHSDGRSWKMIRTKVVKMDWLSGPAYRITTDKSEVIANGEHPWLVLGAGDSNYYFKTGVRWIRTDELRPGHIIKYVVDPWEEDKESWTAGYLAGIADGEGYASNAHVGIVQKPGDTWQWILFMLNEAGFKGYVTEQNKKHLTMCVRFNMTESMRFLGTIRPRRLLQNAYKVWENRKPVGFKPAKVISIEPLANTDLINMVTDCHTFIAEGMVTHNTEYYLDTVVGRLNSKNRDIQNIPPNCRHILLPDNGCFTSGDYQREHLYILANMSGDRDMIDILYNPDPEKADIHQHTANKMGVPRSLAKTLNFAVAYGATAKTISEQAKIKDVNFCGRLLDDWLRAYRGVADWVTTVQRASLKSGWSEPTLFGRRIAIPEEYNQWGALYTEGMKRKAVNYPVLGSDGEIIKRAILLCNGKGLGPPVMAITVHDSIDLDGDHQFPIEKLEYIPGFRIPFEVKQTLKWE